MNLDDALNVSDVMWAGAALPGGGRLYVGALALPADHSRWEVRVHYSDGRKGMLFSGFPRWYVDVVLWRELHIKPGALYWEPY